MRIVLIFTPALLLVAACCTPPPSRSATPATPATWQPEFFDQTLRAAKQAHDRNDKVDAEFLCARAIRYVETQSTRKLYEYADLLEAQRPGSGRDVHDKAERLEQIKTQQAHANQPGSSYLGFAPGDELEAYSALLTQVHRESDATSIHQLSLAHKYSQEAHFRRIMLMRAGKDPRGEC